MFAGRWRLRRHRHDAGIVNHLLQQDRGLRRLDDLDVAVVIGAGSRRAVGDAALRQRPVFGTIRRTAGALGRGGGAFGAPGFGGRRQRRVLAIRRIGNERRAVVPLAVGHPELVVVAGARVVGHLLECTLVPGVEHQLHEVSENRVAALIDELLSRSLQFLQLSVGQRGLVFPLRGTRHRRDAVVAPHALQIGMAIRQARHFPTRGSSARRGAGLSRQGNHGQRSEDQGGSDEDGM